MRQIGTIPNVDWAERFTAFLLTQGILAQAEEENGAWAIWVRNEDHLDEAKSAFERFIGNPDDSQYQDALREASAILDAEAKRREQAQKNLIEMRGRWNRPGSRRNPLLVAIILLCVGVGIVTGFGKYRGGTAFRVLGFCDTIQPDEDWDRNKTSDRLLNIQQGELWRLVTPIFLHGSIVHLLCNMIMLHIFGSVIEDRRGTARFAAIVLVVALVSNLAQGLAPSTWGPFGGGPFFVGISGVVFGLLGYLWMKTTYEPDSGMFVSGSTVAILLIWMILGFAGVLDQMFGIHIANLSHGVGFIAGLGLGYWPQIRRRLTS